MIRLQITMMCWALPGPWFAGIGGVYFWQMTGLGGIGGWACSIALLPLVIAAVLDLVRPIRG